METPPPAAARPPSPSGRRKATASFFPHVAPIHAKSLPMNQHAKRRYQAGVTAEAERAERMRPKEPKLPTVPLATPETGASVYEVTPEEAGLRLDKVLA